MSRSASPQIDIEVVFALPEQQWLLPLKVAAGCTAREAVMRAEFPVIDTPHGEPSFNPGDMPLGVFGERVDDDYPLDPGDRVEIYRPLKLDPMTSRRQRAGKVG